MDLPVLTHQARLTMVSAAFGGNGSSISQKKRKLNVELASSIQFSFKSVQSSIQPFPRAQRKEKKTSRPGGRFAFCLFVKKKTCTSCRYWTIVGNAGSLCVEIEMFMDGAPVPAQIWTSSFRFSCSRLGVPEETPARPRPGRLLCQRASSRPTALRVVRLRDEDTGAWAAAQQTEHWMPWSESRKEPAQFHQNSQKVGER